MTNLPPLSDFSRSRAVIMGTWEYEDEYLESVTAVQHSYDRMISLLTGPLCGWPPNRLYHLQNVSSQVNLADQLIAQFEAVDDVALFYYVGHGQIDGDGQLCLGLTNSLTKANRRATTSLPFQAVRKALAESHAATKIVILDCCFAGLANQPHNSLAAKVLDATVAAGAYVMAASDAYDTAWYETDSSLLRPQTYFTKYLADLVETGMPGYPPFLRLHDLFGRLSANLVRDKLPTPGVRNVDKADEFLFARNAVSAVNHADQNPAFLWRNRDLAGARRQSRTGRMTWWRRGRPALSPDDGPRANPLSPPAIEPFLPSSIDEAAALREIERRVKQVPLGHPGQDTGYSPDQMIDALAAEWVASVREQHAHYVASAGPTLKAAEDNARRAEALAAHDRGLLSHRAMALESAVFRMAGHNRRNQRGEDHDGSR